MITLYDSALSPCAQKVRLVLDEKRINYEPKPVDLVRKENLEPSYLRINPKGLVPTLLDGELVVTESSIIIEYLEDAYPERPLRPVTPIERARMRSWFRIVDDELHPANGAITWPILVMPSLFTQAGGSRSDVEAMVARVPDPVRRERQLRFIAQGLDAPDTVKALSSITKVLDRMETALEGAQWLAGSGYSLADAALTPYLQTFAQFGLWDVVCGQRSGVEDWFKRVSARQNFTTSILESVAAETWDRVREIGSRSANKMRELLAA
jgi:glutathione S-transferase